MERYQKITTSGLLIVDGKALVIRRSTKEEYLTGFYELPGGKVDFGEHPNQSLKREFMEEVNLEVEVKDPYKLLTYISEQGKRHTVEIVYVVELKDSLDNLKLADCHDDLRWVSVEELDDLKMSLEMKDLIVEGMKILK